jgi:hypothetical protein
MSLLVYAIIFNETDIDDADNIHCCRLPAFVR